MSGYVFCHCCHAPIAVSERDIGSTVTCPKTGRKIPVRHEFIHSEKTKPAAPTPAAEPLSLEEDQPERRGSGLWIGVGVVAFAVLIASGAVVYWKANQFARPETAKNEPQPQPAPKAEPEATPKPPPQRITPEPVKPAVVPAKPTPPAPMPTPPAPMVTPKEMPPEPPVAVKPMAPEAAPSPREVVRAEPAPAPPAPPEPVATKPVPPETTDTEPASRLDSRGLAIHSVNRRLDTRSSAELEKSLLAVREVSLDIPGATRVAGNLQAIAKQQKNNSQVYPGAILATGGRPDLAGLPFRVGLDSVLVREKAQAMNGMSKQLREAIQACIPSTDDPRPDTDELFSALISEKKGSFRNRDKRQWARAEAVPCVVQMLQAENKDVRRMSCELLRKLEVNESTDALVKWAVFDTDSENRAAAIEALKTRDRAYVSRQLGEYLDYPWPRAVEHACEALVAIGGQEALPRLAEVYDQPDPDAPFQVDLPNKNGGVFRKELVRVNHPRNCVLCHTPSYSDQDLVRGAVPDPTKPLAPPTTPAYYNSGGQFVAAEITYLQQDFSQVQPVLNSGNWPGHQRFDYFVAVRRERGEAATAPSVDSPYRKATKFAIQSLANRDPDREKEWLAEQRKLAQPKPASKLSTVSKALSVETNPNAYVALKMQEYVKPPLEATAAEMEGAVKAMQKAHGMKASRLALIAYLDPLTRTGDAASRAKAATLLEVATGATPDAGLAKAMRTALE